MKRCITDSPLTIGMRLELVDRLQPERVRPAVVQKIVGGRLNLTYSISDQAEQKKSKKRKTGKESKKL